MADVRVTPVVLIAVAGCSGSGKTTLAHALGKELGAEVVALDCYYRDRSDLPLEERALLNFDSPDAIEHELLVSHMRRLSRGENIARPIYDFTTHTRRAETVLVKPTRFVVLEGLFTLHWPEIRELSAVKVYVDLDDAECYRRRLARDTQERGRTVASVEQQYCETVLPMAKQYVLPTMEWADIVISGAGDLGAGVRAVMVRLELRDRHLPCG